MDSKQISVCCNGNNFTTATKWFTSSVSLTASINQITDSKLRYYLNDLKLSYQNAAIIPRDLVLNQRVEKLEYGPLLFIFFYLVFFPFLLDYIRKTIAGTSATKERRCILPSVECDYHFWRRKIFLWRHCKVRHKTNYVWKGVLFYPEK